jgi:hypothetical protein
VACTIVYIDGFNLFYRALKATAHEWLDLVAMSRAVLPSNCVIERVNYYTARISGRTDPTAPARPFLPCAANEGKKRLKNRLANRRVRGLSLDAH